MTDKELAEFEIGFFGWIKSDKGKETIKKALAEANEVAKIFRASIKIDPELMKKVIDL